MKKWEELPIYMRTETVKTYYDLLEHRRVALLLKRIFDIILASFLLVLLSPVFLLLVVMIKHDSKGPVFFRQSRVTRYGKEFKIFKFRTMVSNAEQIGSQLTENNDPRITKIGAKIRNYRLDEIPQLFNIITGDMSFVGARPEVKKYVDCYTDEMYATLLMPAGVTCEASIRYKDETEILVGESDIDGAYIRKVLPGKMKYNLDYLKDFNILTDLRILFETAWTMAR